MCETSITVWFVCKLCRGSFRQVDAFIEHKKEEHFNQFQKTSCFVFDEREQDELCPFIVQVEDEMNEPRIKIEGDDEDPINPFSSEIIDEQNYPLLEPKSELLTYESEIHPDNNENNNNNYFGLVQPVQNPYVLLKRLTPKEIQNACIPQHRIANSSKRRNSLVIFSKTTHHNQVVNDKSNEIQPRRATFGNNSTEDDVHFECKLCSKQLGSNAQLKIHLGICALHHEDRNRFCVNCNRKFYDTKCLKNHHLRFHGTEEFRLCRFKCHLCPKEYQKANCLRYHMESHRKKKERVETSKSKSLKCSQPNCGKEFKSHLGLRLHIGTIHLGLRPFSCHFPNCSKRFSLNGHLIVHLRTHTGERPYKCSFDNCNRAFMTLQTRSIHHRRVHYK